MYDFERIAIKPRFFCFALMIGVLLAACGGGGGSRTQQDSGMLPEEAGMLPEEVGMLPEEESLPQNICEQSYVDDGGSDGDCIRSLVPGATRFYQERTRIPSTAASPLRFIDMNPAGHATLVHNVAQRMAFIDPPTPFTVNLRGDQPVRTILEEDFDDDSDLIVNVSFGPLFLDSNRGGSLDVPPDLIVRKNVVLVIAAGNQSPENGLSHGQEQGEQAIATGLVLFVAGLDLDMLRQNVYAITQESNSCGWGRVYCVMSSYTTPIPGDPNNGSYNGTSFATPMVASLLANAKLLWPDMTGQQTVQLAQYCARPINDDGTLAPWGMILNAEQANDIWGQGVFSVECLYAQNGALNNPITGVSLRGSLRLTGTGNSLTLADQFSRSYSFSRNGGMMKLSFLPAQTSGAFITKKNIIGFAWRNIALGIQAEKNDFLGIQGTQDFRIGETMIVMAQLGHRFQINENINISLYGLSAWGKMSRPAISSVVRKAQGHTHQVGAEFSYRQDGFQARLAIIHRFGITADIDLGDFGRLHLSPKSENHVKALLAWNF